MLGFIIVKSRESSHKALAVEDVNFSLLQGMQGIRLDQHPAQIQFTKELFEPVSLVVLAGVVAGLAVTAWLLRSRTPQPVLLNPAKHGQSMPSYRRRSALSSLAHTCSHRSAARDPLRHQESWLIDQARMASHRAAIPT